MDPADRLGKMVIWSEPGSPDAHTKIKLKKAGCWKCLQLLISRCVICTTMAAEALETKACIKIGCSLVCGLCTVHGPSTVFHEPLLHQMWLINRTCTHHTPILWQSSSWWHTVSHEPLLLWQFQMNKICTHQMSIFCMSQLCKEILCTIFSTSCWNMLFIIVPKLPCPSNT